MSREEREAKRAARKQRRKKGCLIAVLGVCGAVVLAVILFFVVRAVCDMNGSLGEDKNYVIEIPDGAGTNTIASILQNRGIIESPTAFKLYTKLRQEPAYQRGRHTLNPSMSYAELIAKLESYPDQGTDQDVRLLVPEGYEARQIADALVENGLISDPNEFLTELDQGDFTEFAFVNEIEREENRLEGYLYPATYLITRGSTAHDIITMMLRKFEETVVPLYEQSGTDYTLDEVVTLASIIEREAASDEERGLVASVFNNRLYAGMRLESCATVQYILQERKTVLSDEDTAIQSPYNTYRNAGLPIGPIASPGEKSIQAALHPDETDYMYFVAAADGSRNYFSETYDEHMQKVEEIQGSQATGE